MSTEKDREKDPKRDKELGMDRPITRRDFINGVAVGVGGAAASTLIPGVDWATEVPGTIPAQDRPGYYPPALTGMRGSHPGSFEAAHELRDGDFWKSAGKPFETGETYDLVIVGGGISGLAAAHFWQKEKPDAKILILDNHDDFGGHAKRNEFRPGGRLLLANGGTYAIESPFPYSKVAHGLMDELGIDPDALAKKCNVRDAYQGLGFGIFFDKETFGTDKLVTGGATAGWRIRLDEKFVAQMPLPEKARADVLRIETGNEDYLPGLSSDEKKDKLSRMSYRNFLLKLAKVDPKAAEVYQTRTNGLYGVGIDAVSALDCWALAYPGFAGLKLEPGMYKRTGYTASGFGTPKPPYEFHFPDGNASIVRLLVRKLVPGSIDGTTAEDVVTARADYSKLDKPGQPVRIRLSSIVVGAHHDGEPGKSSGVNVAYIRGKKVFSVRAKWVVMACWNMMIPYLCPELPEKQKEALHYGVKIPLVYTAVAIKNWKAFEKAGAYMISAPGMYHYDMRLDNAVDIGAYKSPKSPEEPILVRMERTPCLPGLPERDQHRAGRGEMLSTTFETFERKIRDQFARTLGPYGFDPAREIDAITVNRWPHGYAYEYNPLFDPDWPEEEKPCVIGRKRFGRIAIANADAGAAAYTDMAIDQAYRAVEELMD
jgi:spermidine dehydrogenase